MNAECLACKENMTPEEYCEKNPSTKNCENYIKKVEYVLTGFAKQSKLNGVYVLRDEKINGAISFAEKDANTILAKGHNGHWWWDDDLADFEHDEMNPDGVWAYAQKGVDFTVANSVTANEWDGGVRQWKPVAIS